MNTNKLLSSNAWSYLAEIFQDEIRPKFGRNTPSSNIETNAEFYFKINQTEIWLKDVCTCCSKYTCYLVRFQLIWGSNYCKNIARGTTDPGYWVYNLNYLFDFIEFVFYLGKLSYKKKGKKRGHCLLLATPPPSP